jgi:uncharacterized alkaline shock family protein YloU
MESGELGRTTMDSKVVKKIVARAATEVDGVGDAPKVTASIDGESATVDIRLSVPYPGSVARTTEAVRAHLIRRTDELTGLAVRRVDIVVDALRGNEAPGRRVL